jgi:citrate lyase subunit beta/citryl-CoA lyase
MRSLLFVPGHRPAMVEKALSLGDLDVALLDLEDGVPAAEKENARGVVASALRRSRPDRPRLFVRVSRAGTVDHDRDLAALSARRPDGVLLSKVERPEEVADVVRAVPQLALIAGIESARGVLAAPAIAAASPAYLLALLFGAEDFANDLGLPASLDPGAREMVHARSSLVLATAAAGIDAIDAVWPAVRDLDGLRRDAEAARRLGFRGKSVIHPSHVAIVNEVFSPSPDEVAWARRVVHAADAAEREGRGATALDGQLVDPPIVARARRTLGG